jgi:hypothetical protein
MPGLVNMVLEEKKIDLDTAKKDQIAEALKEAQEQYLVVGFLCTSVQVQIWQLSKFHLWCQWSSQMFPWF